MSRYIFRCKALNQVDFKVLGIPISVVLPSAFHTACLIGSSFLPHLLQSLVASHASPKCWESLLKLGCALAGILSWGLVRDLNPVT